MALGSVNGHYTYWGHTDGLTPPPPPPPPTPRQLSRTSGWNVPAGCSLKNAQVSVKIVLRLLGGCLPMADQNARLKCQGAAPALLTNSHD